MRRVPLPRGFEVQVPESAARPIHDHVVKHPFGQAHWLCGTRRTAKPRWNEEGWDRVGVPRWQAPPFVVIDAEYRAMGRAVKSLEVDGRVCAIPDFDDATWHRPGTLETLPCRQECPEPLLRGCSSLEPARTVAERYVTLVAEAAGALADGVWVKGGEFRTRLLLTRNLPLVVAWPRWDRDGTGVDFLSLVLLRPDGVEIQLRDAGRGRLRFRTTFARLLDYDAHRMAFLLQVPLASQVRANDASPWGGVSGMCLLARSYAESSGLVSWATGTR